MKGNKIENKARWKIMYGNFDINWLIVISN